MPAPPEPGSQACPRALRLVPGDLWVPAATLGVLLRRGPIGLRYDGWGMLPTVPDGALLEVGAPDVLRRGDLVLVNHRGQADLLRLIAPAPGGAWRTAFDAYPRRFLVVEAPAILGAVRRIDGRPFARRRSDFASRVGCGALALAVRRIAAAPRWGEAATDSVLAKYAQQVADYAAARQSNITPEQLDLLARHVPPGGRLLVAGSGAGSEAIHLAGHGYRVVGFDALPEMVAASAALARESGSEVRFVRADARTGGWPPGPYHAVYMTPLLYSFLRGSGRRIAFLRALGEALAAGGVVFYSARLHRGIRSWLETRLAWCRPRRGEEESGGEPGDWYTRYLGPDGVVGVSYLRRFGFDEILAEARLAGFGQVTRHPGLFCAGNWRPD